jgi:hypothetical protein
MNFHFARKLIALTALWGLLSMSLCWGRTKAPQRCEICCPPSGCGGFNYYFQTSMYAHVTPTNQMYTQKKVTESQLLAAVNSFTAWANYNKAGYTAAATAKIVAMGETAFVNALVNTSNEYADATYFGNVVPASVMTTQLKGITIADAEAIWSVLDGGGGVYQLQLYYEAYLTQQAERIGGKFKSVEQVAARMGFRIPYVLQPTAFFTTCIFVGAVLGLIAITGGGAGIGMIGAMVAFGGTAGNFAVGISGERRREEAELVTGYANRT